MMEKKQTNKKTKTKNEPKERVGQGLNYTHTFFIFFNAQLFSPPPFKFEFLGHSHVDSLFTDKEQEKVDS